MLFSERPINIIIIIYSLETEGLLININYAYTYTYVHTVITNVITVTLLQKKIWAIKTRAMGAPPGAAFLVLQLFERVKEVVVAPWHLVV